MKNNSTLVSLFAGIGGFEIGFNNHGFETLLACEIDPNAQEVLKNNFDGMSIESDVASLKSLPKASVITAGFPCQNLSLVGNNSGIEGKDTRIVNEMFRLLSDGPLPDWLVLENVPFMLWHKGGEAINYVTKKLEELDLSWAYRVVDARAFGIPQRRRRVHR